MSGLRDRFAAMAAEGTIAVALATGVASHVQAQPAPAVAAASADKPFDGSREQFEARTNGKSASDIQRLSQNYLEGLNKQKSAADQFIPNAMRVKDKTLFDTLKKSVADKLDGKAANPEADVKNYLDRKETATKQFFEERLKPNDKPTTQPNAEQMKFAKDAIQNSSDPKIWANATKDWDGYSLQQLEGHAKFSMAQSRMFAGSAASGVAAVQDPKLLAVMAKTEQYSEQNKGAESSLRGELTSYSTAEGEKINGWNKEAQGRVVGATIAAIQSSQKPMVAPAQVYTASPQAPVPKSTVAEVKPLSTVQCTPAQIDAARGGTTVAGPDGRLKLSPADIHQTIKDMTSKPSSEWPDLNRYDKASLRSLKIGLSENMANQLNSVRQAGLGILAGNKPEDMLSGVQNPEIRNLMKDIKPGMPQAQLDYINAQSLGKISENISAARVTIDSAIADIPKPTRERTPVNAPAANAPSC